MKSRLLAACCVSIVVTVVAMTDVRSQADDPLDKEAAIDPAALRVELVKTLASAYESAFADYRGGRSAPDTVCRLNKEWFEAELEVVGAAAQPKLAAAYVERTQKIEHLAKLNVEHGTGMRYEAEDATASRIRAQLAAERIRLLH